MKRKMVLINDTTVVPDKLVNSCSACGAQPGESCLDLRFNGKRKMSTPHGTR